MPIKEIINYYDFLSFAAGFATTALSLYGYARKKGFKLLSKDLETLPEEKERLEKDFNDLKEEIESALGNISLDETAYILKIAKAYSKEGYTSEEALQLGYMIIDAAATREAE